MSGTWYQVPASRVPGTTLSAKKSLILDLVVFITRYHENKECLTSMPAMQDAFLFWQIFGRYE